MSIPETVHQTAAAPSSRAVAEAAIRKASARTGVDFAYLMEKAAVESGFRTDAKAATSSATGMFQFIERTWLDTVDRHGAAHGLGRYADAIERGPDGAPRVASPELRREILRLREDPETAALMAAEYARENRDRLEQAVGGEIGSTELYLAHFLGPSGAARFLEAYRDDPTQSASVLLPEAAAANHNVFFERGSGEAVSLAAVYDRFAAKFDDGDPARFRVATVRAPSAAAGAPRGVPVGPATAPPLSVFTVMMLNGLQTPLDHDRDEDRGAAAGAREAGWRHLDA